jgi:hypothetical protein
MRIDYFHLFSKGLFPHIINNLITIIDTSLCNTHINVVARDIIKNTIDTRSTQLPQLQGFNSQSGLGLRIKTVFWDRPNFDHSFCLIFYVRD